MRVLVACKRGNLAERNKTGHCMCSDCTAFRYRKSNSQRRVNYVAAWRKNNKERLAKYQKKWIKANKEKRREIEKQWRLANSEKVAKYNAKAGAKWASNNKAKRNSSVRARQLAKLKRTPCWADRDAIAKIYEEAAMASVTSGIKHEVDHYYPLQGKTVSGLHVHQNLRVITRNENRSKGSSICES